MTKIYFVRHAQPDLRIKDDRTRPLTETGLKDREKVTELLADTHIDNFLSSPYKRSSDTIAHLAEYKKQEIRYDERLRERKGGINSRSFLEKRWADFTCCEENGECLGSVQKRNIEALTDILSEYKEKTLVIGTHGTALSTIMNYYNPKIDCDWFKRIWNWMPFVICLDFDGDKLVSCEELLHIDRGYGIKK